MRAADAVPAFLEAQKQVHRRKSGLRKQIRANLRRMQRELQIAGREDIDALVAAVRGSQRRILDQLEETSERLQALEAKMDRLSEPRAAHGRRRRDGADQRPATATAARRRGGTRKERR